MQVEKKKKVTKEVVEVVEIIEQYNLCDKCDKRINVGAYDAFEFTVDHTIGTCYPESTDTITESIELCQNCVKDCMLLLKENGYRINKSSSLTRYLAY